MKSLKKILEQLEEAWDFIYNSKVKLIHLGVEGLRWDVRMKMDKSKVFPALENVAGWVNHDALDVNFGIGNLGDKLKENWDLMIEINKLVNGLLLALSTYGFINKTFDRLDYLQGYKAKDSQKKALLERQHYLLERMKQKITLCQSELINRIEPTENLRKLHEAKEESAS